MNPGIDHQLAPPRNGTWFSEALLPSPFLPRFRGDPLGEARTHADGAIGHLVIGRQGKADLELQPDTSHFVICEAKLFGKFSKDVKHAPFYDQAARTVACMAEVLRRQEVSPSRFCQLGFYLLAPKALIDAGSFTLEMEMMNIFETVTKRTRQYNGERDAWMRECFEPFLQRITIRSIAFEQVLSDICDHDPGSGQELVKYYQDCLRYNEK